MPWFGVSMLLLVISAASANAQIGVGSAPTPYAGKYEPRIGGSREINAERLRLDIGTDVGLYTIPSCGPLPPVRFGAAFFTWTRLRSEPNFKFPVEAVDYYFGLEFVPQWSQYVRLRVGHISAHLVDGSAAFGRDSTGPVVYSREFVEGTFGYDPVAVGRALFGDIGALLRPYAGMQWRFHSIPDSLGALTPYVGFDGSWVMTGRRREDSVAGFPLTLLAGYELRMNGELATVWENSVRAGLKFARPDEPGIAVEFTYYRGRSPFGQYFDRMEEYGSIGFSVLW